MDIDSISALYAERGHMAYDGEGITQWQHAWQCGQLALRAGAPAELQLAAWLHDLGHLMTGLEGTPTLQGHDDRHEMLAAGVLSTLFGSAVAQPVALHVLAKRYLVTTNPSYRVRLSPDSTRSLALQGGSMSASECEAFEGDAFAVDALRVRAWDDLGKRRDECPPATAAAELHALMLRVAAGGGS
ncbi:MAG: phosphohydrolase [Rubrivivax sp.]|nr:phosphohydrolase [Rubrivivax sp.]